MTETGLRRDMAEVQKMRRKRTPSPGRSSGGEEDADEKDQKKTKQE